jgi:hypothetical protein
LPSIPKALSLIPQHHKINTKTIRMTKKNPYQKQCVVEHLMEEKCYSRVLCPVKIAFKGKNMSKQKTNLLPIQEMLKGNCSLKENHTKYKLDVHRNAAF